MEYKAEHIDRAIVYALEDILTGDAQNSAKSLRGAIGSFFFLAAGGVSNSGPEEEPEGYCHPYDSELEEYVAACRQIQRASVRAESLGRGHYALIGEITRRSEKLMEKFRLAHEQGNYARNSRYICSLDETNDWGRAMIALKKTYPPR